MSCGTHSYKNINQANIDKMFDSLKAKGAAISGNNPWEIDTNNYGVKLKGKWDMETQTLSVEVTDKDFFVPCNAVWNVIDGLLNQVNSSAV